MLRLGDSETPASDADAGTALPVYVDYYNVLSPATAARPILIIEVPQGPEVDEEAGTYTPGCTLARGSDASLWNFDKEGFPSNTANGAFGIIPCYDVAVGNTLDGSSPKTIALVDRRHRVDTSLSGYISQQINEEPGSNDGWRQIASATGRTFYTSSVALYDAGFRYIPNPRSLDSEGSFVSTRILSSSIKAGNSDARGIALYNGRLYGVTGGGDGFDTIFQFGTSTWVDRIRCSCRPPASQYWYQAVGLFCTCAYSTKAHPSCPLFHRSKTLTYCSSPTSTTSVATKLTGMGPLSRPWTFVFESTSSLWVAVERTSTPRGTVQQWERATPTSAWTLSRTVTFSTTTVSCNLFMTQACAEHCRQMT